MSSRFNFEAQRRSDLVVSQTRKQDDTSWDVIDEVSVNSWNHGMPLPNRPPVIPPRVIRLELDAVNRTTLEDNTVTWTMSMPHVGKIAENSVLYWRNITTNQTEVVDWAIAGLGAHTYAVGGTPYTMRSRFISAGLNEWSPNVGIVAPLAVTLKETDLFTNRRISIVRIGSTGSTLPNIANFFLRSQLIIVEPGASYI